MIDKHFESLVGVSLTDFKKVKKEATKMMLLNIINQGKYEATGQDVEEAKRLLREYEIWKNQKGKRRIE